MGWREYLFHGNGTTWTRELLPSTERIYDATAIQNQVWVLAPTELWRRLADRWELTVKSSARLGARVWTDGTTFWFSEMELTRWDGKLARFSDPTVWSENESITSNWGEWNSRWAVAKRYAPDGFTYLASSIRRWDGTTWTIARPASTTERLEAIHGTSDTNVWAVGNAGVTLSWNGAKWTMQIVPGMPDLKYVQTFGPSDVWAASAAALYHFDGRFWTTVPTVTSIAAVWGTSSKDLWVASAKTNVLHHFDGTSWTEFPLGSPENRFFDIWGVSSTKAWASADVGTGSTHEFRWDGQAWTEGPPAFAVLNREQGSSCHRGTQIFVFGRTQPIRWNDGVWERWGTDALDAATFSRGCALDPAGNFYGFTSTGAVVRRSARWR